MERSVFFFFVAQLGVRRVYFPGGIHIYIYIYIYICIHHWLTDAGFLAYNKIQDLFFNTPGGKELASIAGFFGVKDMAAL